LRVERRTADGHPAGTHALPHTALCSPWRHPHCQRVPHWRAAQFALYGASLAVTAAGRWHFTRGTSTLPLPTSFVPSDGTAPVPMGAVRVQVCGGGIPVLLPDVTCSLRSLSASVQLLAPPRGWRRRTSSWQRRLCRRRRTPSAPQYCRCRVRVRRA